MQVGLAQCVNKGMQRDYSMDKASQEFAYENKNIRITTTGNNSFLSVTNEKSTIPMLVNIEVPEEKIAYYNLNITRSQDGSFDGVGKIESAKIVFSKPLILDATFILNVTTSFVDAPEQFTVSAKKGQSEIDLQRYVANTAIGDVLYLRVLEDPKSSIVPVWIDHENPPIVENIGTVLGSATIGNKVIIFTKYDVGTDAIIVGEPDTTNNVFNCSYLYQGDLNFNINNPIECITSYEADDVQKIYWVDGVNQPRVANICNMYTESTSFDFSPKIPEGIQVNIAKEYNGSGSFPSGVIQYFITFYTKFGSETNAAYESSLYYISPEDRGGEPNEINTCSFKISISTESNDFEYARVYSVLRTSLNSSPQVYIVEDVNIKEGESTTIIDNNIYNTPIAATDVLFLGGNSIIARTIEQKDNTLFLGDIKEITTDIIEDIKNIENKGTLVFGSKFIHTKSSNNIYYPYTPNLDLSSKDIKTFKYLEWYKIGIQFQMYTGEWSSVVELGDIQNNIKPLQQSLHTPYPDNAEFDNGMWLPAVSFTPSEQLLDILKEKKTITNWRLVMAEHSNETRTIKSQGLVLPTIFNLQERANDTCYSSPLWTVGTALYSEHMGNVDLDFGANDTEDSSARSFIMYPYFHLPTSIYYNKENNYFKLNSVIRDSNVTKVTASNYLVSIKPIISITRYFDWSSIVDDEFICTVKLGVKDSSSNSGTQFYDVRLFFERVGAGNRRLILKRLSEYVNSALWADIWDQSIGNLKVSDLANISKSEKIFKPDEIPSGDSLRDDYGVTSTNDIVIDSLPTYVRDIVFTKEIESINNYGNQYFVDANICNFISPNAQSINNGLKFRIVGYTDISNSISDYSINVENNVIDTTVYKAPEFNLNTFKMPLWRGQSYFTGIRSLPLWPYDNRLFYINYWNSAGNILNDKFNIKSKSFANMWVCSDTTYTEPINYGNVSDLLNVNNGASLLDSKIYKAEYSNVLIPKDSVRSFVGGDEVDGVLSKQPVNETVPLSKLADIISDSLAESPMVEDTNSANPVSITYKSSEHTVFKLPSKKGFFGILPNYTPTKKGDSFIYSDSIYPMGTRNTDYFFSVEPTENLNIGNIGYEKQIQLVLNSNSLQIATIGGDSSILINIDYSNFIHPSVTLVEDGKSPTQPSIREVYEDFINNSSGTYNYLRKSLLFGIQGCNGFLILDNLNSCLKSGTSVIITATLQVLDFEHPITYTYEGKSYLLDYPESIENTSKYRYFSLYRTSMFKVPEITDNRYTENKPKLFIGEFYTEYNKDTFFGGDSKNCTFIPIGDTYPITSSIGWGFEGDTYYQRYDNVRVYESSKSDVNQNIDAVSFMLETYKNLDGDYRKLRGRLDTTNLTVENTNNIINNVYSQSNNYKTSNILDDKFEDSTHPTLYTWSLSKQNLANVDNWTSINLASSLKLDGDKGALNKIKRWNNYLLAFQDKGIAAINFNQQTTISTSEGIPVEIANSGKVTGHYYISSTQGCKNKWSIVESPYGIYFIDGYNKSINVFSSEGIKSLSTINLFKDWVNENEKGLIWNPSNNGGFKSFYDPINNEVYFVNDTTALCYNELLSQFTSFYDYDKLTDMIVLKGSIYGVREGEIHRLFEGDDYCNLFNRKSDYSITYKINKDSFIDKTWTNIEYRADVFDSGNIQDKNSNKIIDDTFNTLEVWNEYQKGTTTLNKKKYPNARNKFRIWRVDIPRSNEGRKLDRIRNPWIMLKITKNTNTSSRMEFHDLVVKYLY